jgi:hypothetical protein
MKIPKSEIDRMINEEFQKIMEKRKLSARLSQINEELSNMDSEDSLLNEVEAGGQEKVSSHAWTGEENGDVKYKPKFEKIGTHLKEEDGDVEMMGAGEEAGEEAEEAPMGEFEAKFAEIGKAIDAKMSAEMGASAPTGEEAPMMGDDNSDEDFEEVQVGDDSDEEGEIEEYNEKVGGEGKPEGMHTHDGTEFERNMEESVEEPLEGESVAQMTDADNVNDNMEKDSHVHEGKNKEGAILSEGASTEKNIFTEGVDAAKKAKLMEEMNRMRKFAGLSRDEE